MRVPYTLPLLPELARVNVMIVGSHLDNLHVSAACRMPALAFRLALATMSLPAIVVVRVMVRKTWKAKRGASAASGYPAHDTRTLPTHWRGSAGPRARVATLTSNVRLDARCRLSWLPLESSFIIGVTSPRFVRCTPEDPTSAADRPRGNGAAFVMTDD